MTSKPHCLIATGVGDGKTPASANTASTSRNVDNTKWGFDGCGRFLKDVDKDREVGLQGIKCKMALCGSPGLTGSRAVPIRPTYTWVPYDACSWSRIVKLWGSVSVTLSACVT